MPEPFRSDEGPDRHMALIMVSDEFLIRIMQSGTRSFDVVKNALPPGVRLVDARYDGRNIMLKVEGDGLPLVRDGQQIPTLDIWFKESDTESELARLRQYEWMYNDLCK